MSYYKNSMTTFAGKMLVLLLIAGCITPASRGQNHINFTGEWKLNESKSEITEQFPLCIFGGDRMRSKTLKIGSQAHYMTVDFATSYPDGALYTRQAQLTFDGKENEATYVGISREKSSARWSDDGQTMTVTSVRSFDKNGTTADFTVREDWKLIDGGKSISIQVNSRSKSRENTMTLVYDKQSASDYRF